MTPPFEFPSDANVIKNESTFIITKWNWDFKECEVFQETCREFVEKNRNYKFYIFTNHPHVFTHGRGNERGRDDLVDFEKADEDKLDFPLHYIHRGGGLTFHYPGQWIAYPILAVKEDFTLDDHMCWLLKGVREVLTETFDIDNVITAKKLMGVWREKKKLASIGVGLKRFVTLHGLALNLNYDENMFNAIQKINPCGMQASTYMCVDQIINNTNLLESFHQAFLKKYLL